MLFPGMCCRGAVVGTDVAEDRVATIIMVKRISELGTTDSIPPQRASVASYCLRYSYLADSFHPDDGGDMFLRNIGSHKRHTA
jgi:hypothetical protein